MRKLSIILLLVAGSAWAQSDTTGIADEVGALLGDIVSAQDLDLSDASIHQSGPDSFYVRSVGIDGSDYSLTFAQDANGIWTLTTLNSESDNLLPARTVLDFASLTAVDGQTIQIDGVFVDGQVYSGSLAVGESAGLSLTGDIAAGSVDAVNQARALALAELAVAETTAAFREELEEQRLELEAVIDQVEAQRDGYKAERDTLADERDELSAERDTLAEELAALAAAPAATVPPITFDTPATDEQVAALIRERDDLAGDLVGLAVENNTLRDANKSLAEQIADLQTENDRLQSELASMTNEVRRLTELVEAYRSAATAAAPAGPAETATAAAETEATVAAADAPEATTATADESEAADAETATEDTAVEPEAVATPAAAPATPLPEWSLPGDYLKTADLEAAAASVTAELQLLEQRLAGLEEAAVSLARLEETLRTGVGDGMAPVLSAPDQPGTLMTDTTDTTATPALAETAAASPTTTDPVVATAPEAEAESAAETSAEPAEEPPAATASDAEAALAAAQAARDAAASAAELAAVSAELAELVRLNEELRRETLELENRILNEILSNGLVAMMAERMTQTLRTGFAGSEPDVGDWSVSGSRAVQQDSDAFFAKLAIPAEQRDEPVLYSFRVRALDPSGWVGVGLHFFVSDVELRRGYGMGRSLLVWLTRDPDVYKTQYTYLQLYRSDDDINMGRVLDAVIEEPISDYLDVEVLYEPDNQYMTVAIDGEDKIRYRTWFGIDSGVEIALRTLGAAEFSNFRIQTEPTESASIPVYGTVSF